MLEYICVGLVSSYITYHSLKCATKKPENEEKSVKGPLRLL